jgi:hypothetical protein
MFRLHCAAIIRLNLRTVASLRTKKAVYRRRFLYILIAIFLAQRGCHNSRPCVFVVLRDRRFPSRFNWILSSSGLLSGVRWFALCSLHSCSMSDVVQRFSLPVRILHLQKHWMDSTETVCLYQHSYVYFGFVLNNYRLIPDVGPKFNFRNFSKMTHHRLLVFVGPSSVPDQSMWNTWWTK